MDVQAPQGVGCRGLGFGTAIGALVGGLTPAFAGLLTQGWRGAIGGLVLGLVGAVIGAVVGFLCAIIPTVLLAVYRSYFLRHDWFARLSAVSVGAVLLIVAAAYTAVHWHGSLTYEAIATVPLACGLILGACLTDRVLTGGAANGHWCCVQRARRCASKSATV